MFSRQKFCDNTTILYLICLTFVPESAPNLAGVHLDLAMKQNESAQEMLSKIPVIPPHPHSAQSMSASRTMSGKSRLTSATSSRKAKTPATMKTYEMPLQPLVCFLPFIYNLWVTLMLLFGTKLDFLD